MAGLIELLVALLMLQGFYRRLCDECCRFMLEHTWCRSEPPTVTFSKSLAAPLFFRVVEVTRVLVFVQRICLLLIDSHLLGKVCLTRGENRRIAPVAFVDGGVDRDFRLGRHLRR